MSSSGRYQGDSQTGTDEHESQDLMPLPSSSVHICRSQFEYRPIAIAAELLLLEGSHVVGCCDVESGHETHGDGISGWDDQLFSASQSEYSQTLPDGPHIGYYSVNSPTSQSSEPTNTIPDSSPHYIQLDANIESLAQTHSFHPGANIHSIPATSSSPDLGGRYCATSPCSSTGDSVESGLDPLVMIPRSFKPIVASGNVLGASLQRRKDKKSDGKYKCRGFGTCKATFTTSHNLKNHVRSHRGERPFKCSFCPRRMVTRSDIKRHEKKCKFSIVIPGSSQVQ